MQTTKEPHGGMTSPLSERKPDQIRRSLDLRLRQQIWERFNPLTGGGDVLKKLRGGSIFALGFLMSPLCWWNDLFFNLPITYFFWF